MTKTILTVFSETQCIRLLTEFLGTCWKPDF